MAGGGELLDFLQDNNPNMRANERIQKNRKMCESTQSVFIRPLFSSLQEHHEDTKAQSDHADKMQPLSKS